MAVNRVPVETWQTILRYSISIPVFFDTDPIKTSGMDQYVDLFDDASAYWKSERHRNILRRVCCSWNSYLQTFYYRYVELQDVAKGLIPRLAFTCVIQLQYSDYQVELLALKIIIQQAIQEHTLSWSLEILQGSSLQIDEIILRSGRVPALKFVENGQGSNLQSIATFSPNIQFVDLWSTKSFTACSELSQLTSMSIAISSITPLLNCGMKSLKYLSIFMQDSPLRPMEIKVLLQAFGKNLILFFNNSRISRYLIPEEVWSFCPRLENFQTGLMWDSEPQIPPSLHTICFSTDLLYYNSLKHHVIPARLLRKDSIRTVSLDERWWAVIKRSTNWENYVMHVLDCNCTFQDLAGVVFQEFIVTMLSHQKERRRRPPPMRYWGQSSRIF